MIKLLILSLTIVFFTSGCQDNASKAYLLNGQGVNPNSLAYKANNKAQDRQNKLKISKMDSDTKIQIAKIESNNNLLIAKVKADATKEVAQTDSNTKIQTTKIAAMTKKEDSQMTFYIAIALVLVVMIALILLFLNNKHNRELKAKLHEDKLKQELDLKEREHHEQRLHKMLDLIADGKLSPKIEEEIILSISNDTAKTVGLKK
jgi:hypothetical protein